VAGAIEHGVGCPGYADAGTGDRVAAVLRRVPIGRVHGAIGSNPSGILFHQLSGVDLGYGPNVNPTVTAVTPSVASGVMPTPGKEV
jgi:hypothetical protein